MLLPEVTIPVLIDVFIANFRDFFYDYVSKKNLDLALVKNDISHSVYRYSIYLERKKSEISQQLLIGEIDVIKVHNNRTDIRCAVHQIKDYEGGLRFFDKFYLMIFKKWNIDFNVELLNFRRGEGATMQWVIIGWDTGYFCLPEVYNEMFYKNDSYDEYLKYAPSDFEINDYLPESEKEKIRKEYFSKITKGLVDFPKDSAENIKKSEFSSEFISEIVNQIDDHNYDRYILKRWWEDATVPTIGEEIDRSDRTVYNRLSTLRSIYGTNIVPLNRDRKKK